MSTSRVYYPHGIYASTFFTLTQISGLRPMHDAQDLIEWAAGQPGPQFTGTHQATPSVPFRCTQLKDILDVTIAGNYNISRDLSAGNVDIEFKAGSLLNVRTADATLQHVRARMTENTMFTIESISARQGSLAEAQCRLSPYYNSVSGADPLVFANTVALTIESAIAHLFTLGPIKLNGSFIEGVEEATLDNQVQYEIVHDGGFGFPAYVAIKTYSPRIRFLCRDSRVMNTFGTRGTALSALSMYFRKKLESGHEVPDATEEHIKITSATGTIKARELGDNSAAEVTIDLKQSAQNTAAYVVDTTAAIT
jgi:hypothetical protein